MLGNEKSGVLKILYFNQSADLLIFTREWDLLGSGVALRVAVLHEIYSSLFRVVWEHSRVSPVCNIRVAAELLEAK